jgi:hypothetical protein
VAFPPIACVFVAPPTKAELAVAPPAFVEICVVFPPVVDPFVVEPFPSEPEHANRPKPTPNAPVEKTAEIRQLNVPLVMDTRVYKFRHLSIRFFEWYLPFFY